MVKKKELNGNAYSTNIYPNGITPIQIKKELVEHLNQDRKKPLSLSDEQIHRLWDGLVDSYGWRQIGDDSEARKKQANPNGKKGERAKLTKLYNGLINIEKSLYDLTVDDERLLDGHIYDATTLHLEPAHKDDNKETLANKLLLQRSDIIEPDTLLNLRNKTQGRGKMALIIKQLTLGVEYATRKLNTKDNNKKLRKYMTEIHYLSCFFQEVFPNRRISHKSNSLFHRYVKFYLRDYYKYQRGKYPPVQITTVISNYLNDRKLMEANHADPLGSKKKLLDTYKK